MAFQPGSSGGTSARGNTRVSPTFSLSAPTPTFVNRKYVYRYEDALKLEPDAVAALNVPPHFLQKRGLAVKEVPWEVAQSPEYQAERARNKVKEAAFLGAMFMMMREQDKQGGGIPDCVTPVRNSEGREIIVPC